MKISYNGVCEPSREGNRYEIEVGGIPAYIDTCDFNGMLMATFTVQGEKRLVERVWAMDKRQTIEGIIEKKGNEIKDMVYREFTWTKMGIPGWKRDKDKFTDEGNIVLKFRKGERDLYMEYDPDFKIEMDAVGYVASVEVMHPEVEELTNKSIEDMVNALETTMDVVAITIGK